MKDNKIEKEYEEYLERFRDETKKLNKKII